MTVVKRLEAAFLGPCSTGLHVAALRIAAGWLFSSAVLCAVAGPAAPQDRPPAWASLTVAQQQALAPLKGSWASIDRQRKQKWIEVATRFPSMPEDERLRVQERMGQWAALTPAERTRARLQFQATRQISPEERQARWEAYQALSEEERRQLAWAAKPLIRPGNGTAAAPAGKSAVRTATGGLGTESTQAKRNVVFPIPAPPARAVAPTLVQAKPGVSTTTMATRPEPPVHHQAGLPKIVATPGFVDPATLLPKRGPQGAAVRDPAPPQATTVAP